jgi:hypothetical protein
VDCGAASAVNVTVEQYAGNRNMIAIEADIVKPDNTTESFTYAVNWSAQGSNKGNKFVM